MTQSKQVNNIVYALQQSKEWRQYIDRIVSDWSSGQCEFTTNVWKKHYYSLDERETSNKNMSVIIKCWTNTLLSKRHVSDGDKWPLLSLELELEKHSAGYGSWILRYFWVGDLAKTKNSVRFIARFVRLC